MRRPVPPNRHAQDALLRAHRATGAAPGAPALPALLQPPAGGDAATGRDGPRGRPLPARDEPHRDGAVPGPPAHGRRRRVGGGIPDAGAAGDDGRTRQVDAAGGMGGNDGRGGGRSTRRMGNAVDVAGGDGGLLPALGPGGFQRYPAYGEALHAAAAANTRAGPVEDRGGYARRARGDARHVVVEGVRGRLGYGEV